MAEAVKWKEFMVPIVRVKQRLIQITDVGPEGQVFFDPISHYLYREQHLEHNQVRWHIADLPCNKGKPRP